MGVAVAVGGASDEELAAVRRLFERWDSVFSRFRPDSELNSVKQNASPVLFVSGLFAHALRAALSAAAATDGLGDPTLGRAIEAAGYDTEFSLLRDDDERPLGSDRPGAGGRFASPGGCPRASSRSGIPRRVV
jgi:thiamine biosynthesis lipoprotein ApbE